LLARLATDGSIDLGTAYVSRVGKASVVELRNSTLDATTLAPLETAIDLAILDRHTEIAVLRGGAVKTAKYASRPLLGSLCEGAGLLSLQ
jgi:hypothetical protein